MSEVSVMESFLAARDSYRYTVSLILRQSVREETYERGTM